jgi:L-ascorbate oxidase
MFVFARSRDRAALGCLLRRWLGTAYLVATLACGTVTARAGEFVEPQVFSSSHGMLDLLMIARPKPVPSISFQPPRGGPAIEPTGWVYEICPRPRSGNECPMGAPTVSDYGGVRLALQQGDTLKIRLVNRLPLLDPAKVTHVTDPGQGNLFLNPTNLHTHGLVVQARAPTLSDPTFGDDVFVDVFNPANGLPVPQTSHQHGSIKMDFVDYRIDIPANHPSGQFWFHPHVHGISLNQLSGGLSGIISIGKVGQDRCDDEACGSVPEGVTRHLILKDMQVLAAAAFQENGRTVHVSDGEVQYQEDPTFCAQYPASASESRQGSCPGADRSADEDKDFTGGRWYFTVNGQPFPTVRMNSPDGEMWQLTNASGSASYDLQLVDDARQAPMIMQLVSVDGVSIHVPLDTPPGTIARLGGARFKVVACPPAPTSGFRSLPVCVTDVVLMPSARAELWVTYRDAAGNIVTPAPGATATFKTIGLTAGAFGDAWPAVDLAKVEFAQRGPLRLSSFAMNVDGEALTANLPTGIFTAPVPYARAAPLPAGCAALPPGHRRRIFFGLEDTSDPASFGLGYEEVDQHGGVVPGTEVPVRRFDPSHNTICLPLGPEQTPVHEAWEIINLGMELHNFHIHQTKFSLIGGTARPGLPQDRSLEHSAGPAIMEDNVPLSVVEPNVPTVATNQNGYCTVDQWRNGQCSSTPVVVDIPFSQLGEFIFHCHILEHEDGGMMAKIQVVPAPPEDRDHDDERKRDDRFGGQIDRDVPANAHSGVKS